MGVLHFRVDDELKKAIKERANNENRTMSNYILTAVKEKLQKERK